MKTFPRLLILLAVLVSALPALADPWTSPDGTFSLTPPTGWTVNTQVPNTAVVAFMAPKADPGFHSNVNVMVIPVPPEVTLKVFTDENKKSLAKQNANIREDKAFKLGSNPGNLLVFDFTYQGTPLVSHTAYALVGNKIYQITGVSQPDNFKKYQGAFAEISRSLVVKK